MLKKLVISNLAIIENIEIDFKSGFTVLTGGTGAGKSLVIDSLGLLLGDRATSELIRTGEEKATITGYFNIDNSRLEALLNNMEIPFSDNQVIVTRIISKTKNIIKVNDKIISLQELNKISKFLADIHNQFDFAKILNPDNYLEIIDGFSYDLTNTYKNQYTDLLDDYKRIKSEYNDLIEKKNKIEAARDFYEFQYKELKALNLKENEQEEILDKISLLKNYDKIYSLSQEAKQMIDDGFLDQLYELNKIIANIGKYQASFNEIHDKINDHYYELDDLFETLNQDFKNLDYDPKLMEELQARDAELNNVKRKYKKSIPELIAYYQELETTLGDQSNFDLEIENKKKELDEAFNKTLNKGEELTEVRKKLAKSIEKELKRNLSDLLLKVEFEIQFNDIKDSANDSIFKENGVDEVDFLIETNIGEGLKSLSKIISGGEASRIMLGFKEIFIKANKISTVIFDEIDTGISGEAAEAVAKKIYQISLIAQVIAITHMPQVASLSDFHILIKKEIKNNRTYTSIKELNLEEKIKEVAHLISSGEISAKQLDYAKEMVLRNR